MPKFYAYIRVSKQVQVEQGYSLDAQEARARAYFEYLRQTPGRDQLVWGKCWIEKGKSAYKLPLIQRPVGEMMHESLRPGDHVVFIRLDRGFRNTRDFLNTYPIWEDRGVTIHFLDLSLDLSTANGKLMATLIAAIAEWESAVKSERTRAGLAAKARRGEATNQHGRGMRIIGQRMVPDFEQIAIGRLMQCWHEVDELTYEEISDRMERLLAVREGRKYRRRCETREWGLRRATVLIQTRVKTFAPDRMERRVVGGKIHFRVLGADGQPVSDWYASRATAEREALAWRAHRGIGYKCAPGKRFAEEEVRG